MKHVLTNKSGRKAFVDEENYEFNINRVRETSTGIRTYLRCKQFHTIYKCPAKAQMTEDQTYLYCSGEHNHCSNAPKVVAKLLVQEQKERAVANPQIEPRVLWANMIGNRNLLPNVKAAMPDKRNFAQMVHKARNEDSPTGGLKEPKTFSDLVRDMPQVCISLSNEVLLIKTNL